MKQTTNSRSNKLFIVFYASIFIALFVACSPAIQYLGDTYQTTEDIDVYYDEKDVQKEYKTIGKMTHGNMWDYEVETIRNKMIEVTKRKGGDAIIFLEMKNVREHDNLDDLFDEDRISITAQVIRYKKP